jgi:hypothetical protein
MCICLMPGPLRTRKKELTSLHRQERKAEGIYMPMKIQGVMKKIKRDS